MEWQRPIELAVIALQKVEEKAPLEELKDYRRRMLELGFANPFAFLPKITLKDVEKEESEERRKQLKALYDAAVLKRAALVRTNLAIKARLMEKGLRMLNMEDLASFLPTRGELIMRILYGGEITLYTYERIKERLKRAKAFKSNHAAKVLASAISAFAFEEALRALYDTMKEYNDLLEKLGLNPFSNLEEVEGFEFAKEALARAGYATYSPTEGFKLKEEVREKLEESIAKLRELTDRLADFALMQLFTRLFIYFTPREMRRVLILPNLNRSLSLEELLPEDIAKALREKVKLGLNKEDGAALLAKRIGREKARALLGFSPKEWVDEQGEDFLKRL